MEQYVNKFVEAFNVVVDGDYVIAFFKVVVDEISLMCDA